MSRFTDRLWRDLVREHGPDLAQMEPRLGAAHRRRARPGVLAGTGVGVAGVVTAAVLILGAASSTPAFAVARNRDGSYSVRVESWSAIPAANRAIHGLGLHAQVVAVSAGCGSGAGASTVTRKLRVAHAVSETTPALIRARLLARQARIDPRRIPAGKMLMIPAWRVGREVRMTPATVVGSAPACMVPPCALHAVTAPAPGIPGNSGGPLHASRTQLHPMALAAPRKLQVPVKARQQLVRLARLVAKSCPKPGAGAPPPGGGNSGHSGTSGNG